MWGARASRDRRVRGIALLLPMAALLAGPACAAAPRRLDGAALASRLEKPDGPGPFPAVILMHGCAGPKRKDRDWARFLRRQGYVALVTDGFGPRGVKTVCGSRDEGAPTSRDRAGDAAEARRWLAAQPFVDPARIALMGFSHGGKAVLRAALRGAGVPAAEPPFAAVVALYPPCFPLQAGQALRSPLLLLIGGDDDWASPDRCRAFAAEVQARGQAMTLVVYPGARHDFDAVGLDTWKLGHHLLHDPAAHADAEVRVRDFLAGALGK